MTLGIDSEHRARVQRAERVRQRRLEELIGRRAKKPILHPADGRILVRAGCLITRTAIRQFVAAAPIPEDR